MITEKKCSKCLLSQGLSYFSKRTANKDGFSGWCKACWSDYRDNTPTKEREREYRLRCVYGIDTAEYNRLFQEQKGCCAICRRHQSEFKKSLHVDHSHESKKVRGLLCGPCNQLIGLAKESQKVLCGAAKYLESTNTEIQIDRIA